MMTGTATTPDEFGLTKSCGVLALVTSISGMTNDGRVRVGEMMTVSRLLVGAVGPARAEAGEALAGLTVAVDPVPVAAAAPPRPLHWVGAERGLAEKCRESECRKCRRR